MLLKNKSTKRELIAGVRVTVTEKKCLCGVGQRTSFVVPFTGRGTCEKMAPVAVGPMES